MPVLLFSYGTLQMEQVQLTSFGRLLHGEQDLLPGYTLKQLEIKDPEVLAKSGKQFHPIAVPSDDPSAGIEGMVFEITAEELQQADQYEVADYKRVPATFRSGKQGWVYVAV